MPQQYKIDKVAEISDKISSNAGLFVVGYSGLTVAQSQDLRKRLRGAGAEMKVFKNNLVRIALEQQGQPDISDMLTGPCAYVFYEKDPVEAAKVLRDFSKEAKDVLEVKGGISDGVAVSAAQVEAIADLPSHDQLIGMVLNVSLAPVTGVVRVINGPIQSLINVLDAIKDQKEEEEKAAA